jgi:hypothetical protein
LPVLPNHMAEFLESPVPVIAGLPFAPVDAFGRRLTSADELSDDTVVWFPASHSFWISQNIRNELLGTSPSLPRRDELAHMLRPFLDVLRSHSSNGNHMESMTSGSGVARTALKVSAEETATDGTARKKSFTSLFPSLSWLENSFAASPCSSIPSSLPSPTRTASSRRTLNFNPDQAQLEACSVILNVIHEYNSTLLIHVLQLKRSAQQQAKNTDNNVNDTLAVLDILNRRSHADIYDIQWRMSLADYDLPPDSKSLPDGKGSREHKVVTALLESNMIHHFIHKVVAKVLKSKEL